jgi:hypothetical protein
MSQGTGSMAENEDDHVVRLTQHPRSKNKLLIPIVAVVVVVLAFVSYTYLLGPREDEAQLVESLGYTITKESYSHHSVVRVIVSGWIINEGEHGAYAVIKIDVYDGSVWESYSDQTEEIPKKGMIWYIWSQDYASDDETAFRVEHTVTAL